MSAKIELPLNKGYAWYNDRFLDYQEQEDLKQFLWKTYHWEQPKLKVFGKLKSAPASQ